MPNKANIKKWVEALRSGKFTQGQSALEATPFDKTKHCCLGVACRVAMQNGVDIKTRVFPGGTTTFDGHDAFLPEKVQKWLGIDSDSPVISNSSPVYVSAVSANDVLHHSFAEIADMIEEKYLRTSNGQGEY